MSTGKRVLAAQIIQDGYAGGSDPIYSSVFAGNTTDNYAVQINVVDGSPTGTIKIQGSLDYSDGVGVIGTDGPANAGTWADIPTTPTSPVLTAGSPASQFVFCTAVSIQALRVVYTPNGSTEGHLDIYVNAHEV